MFENFDVSVLEDPEFQEDSVREEIIAPILRHLGYYPSGSIKIIRSKKLSHPFVNIGSRTNKINIIPDYVLEADGKPLAVIDAKSPQVSIKKSSHVEQVYSYAIHPEIRAKIYSLCNGREWIIWDTDKFEPVAKIKINDLLKDISIIEKYLHPKSLEFPERRNFLPDYGLRMKKFGIEEDSIQVFIANEIGNISKVEDELYTTNVRMDLGEGDLLISFDLSKEIYLYLLSLFPEQTQSIITQSLSRQPFYADKFDPIWVSFSGHFGNLTEGAYEEFVPIVVTKVEPVSFMSLKV